MPKNYRKRFPRHRKNTTIDDNDLVFTTMEFLDASANNNFLKLSEMEIDENDLTLTIKDFNYLIKLLKNNRKTLSNREKDCIFLFYWKHLSQQKIAGRLKIKRTSVATYLKIARQKIAFVLHYNLEKTKLSY